MTMKRMTIEMSPGPGREFNLIWHEEGPALLEKGSGSGRPCQEGSPMIGILLIDDVRDLKVATKVARTFESGLEALKEGGWDELYIDHDLGTTDPQKTGYDLMCWLEQNPSFVPKKIRCISANAVGAARIQYLINKLGAQ